MAQAGCGDPWTLGRARGRCELCGVGGHAVLGGSWQAGPPAGMSLCCPSSWHQFLRKKMWGKQAPPPPATALTKGQRETQCQESGDRQRSLSLCRQVQRHPRDARTGWTPGGGEAPGHPCQREAGGDSHPSKWESKTRKQQ